MFFPSLYISVARAAENAKYQLNYQFPGGPQVVESPADYVYMIFRFGLGIVGIIALGFIVYGGIRYILSAGNPSALADAKNQMLSALIGIALLLSSYVILREINPELVELKNPVLIEVTPEAKFNLDAIRESWRKLGNNLEAIQAKINEGKRLENDAYKAYLTAMSDEQRLIYFKGLNPIAQRNYITTLSGFSIPFQGIARELNADEVSRTYESLGGLPAQTELLHRLNAPQTEQMYNYAGDPTRGGTLDRQRNILAQMSDAQYAPLYAVFQSQDNAARAQGKESNRARDFIKQISEYRNNDLKYRIAVQIAKTLREDAQKQFVKDLRAVENNFGSTVSLILNEAEEAAK